MPKEIGAEAAPGHSDEGGNCPPDFGEESSMHGKNTASGMKYLRDQERS